MPAAEVCSECNGTGWKIVERDEVSGAVRCGCASTGRAERLESEAGIPPLYAGASFENFLLSRDNPIGYRELTEVYLAVRGFAREFPNAKKPGLLLMGEPWDRQDPTSRSPPSAPSWPRGSKACFFDYQNLLDRIRSGYDASSNSSDREAYSVAMEVDVLLLDDLGAHRVTDWVEDTVTSIITTRCNNRKPLIATTNLIDPEAGHAPYERTAEGKGRLSNHVNRPYRSARPARVYSKCAGLSKCRWSRIFVCAAGWAATGRMMVRAAALLLASAALAPAWVESVEFPWNACPRPLWESQLVWLKNIGITHVSLPPAAGCLAVDGPAPHHPDARPRGGSGRSRARGAAAAHPRSTVVR